MRQKPNGNDRISFLRKIMNKVRYGMILQVFKNRLARMGFEFTPYYWFQEGLSDSIPPGYDQMLEVFPVEDFKADDIRLIGKNGTGYTVDQFLKLLAEGEKCIGIKYKGEVAAFMWINLKEARFKASIIPMNRDEAYLWNMYTMESFRGKNLAPYLRYRSYEILHQMGKDKLYSISEYFNSPAIKFKKKLDSRIIKLMLYIQVFKKFHWTITLKSRYS